MKDSERQMYFISLTDRPNGAENVLLKMALIVKGRFIIVKKHNGISLHIPNSLIAKYLSKTNIFFGLLKLIPLLRKIKKNEVVMSTHPYLNAYLGFLKRIGYLKSQLIVRECTSVFTRFSGLKKLAYQLIYKLGYPAADLVVCQTEIMKTQFLTHNQFINKNKVLVQPNPVDFIKLDILAKQPLNNSETETEFICTAGRLIPEKGFDILIKAFKIIQENNPQLKLFLLGEGKEKRFLSQLIKNYNLEDAVIFKGYVANPAPYFKNAKLCVVSSIKEGFPNVLLEMMALNQAVVSTICAGGISTIPNITKVEVNNAELLAAAIKNTLTKSPKPQKNPNRDYLKQHTPKIFAKSILNALATT